MAFSVFPSDVWEILLNKYITDPMTRLHCMYSSQSFQNDEVVFKWKQNRVIRLLPQVLSILKLNGNKSYLDDSDIKTLRLVSKNWQVAVNKFTVESPLDNRHVCGPTPRIWLFKQNVDEILGHFASASFKKYNVKSLHIAEDLETHHLKKVTKILEIIGPSLLGLTWCTGTYIKYQILNGGQWYEFLNKLLDLVPNLKSLQLSVVLFEDFEDLSVKYKVFGDEINDKLAIIPIPNLGKLQTFKIDEHVPSELLNGFIHRNPKVRLFRL